MVYGSADYLQLSAPVGINHLYVPANDENAEILPAETVSFEISLLA